MRSISGLFFLVLSFGIAAPAGADRIKDLTSVASVRSNQLIGYGLVVGLQGTGDGSDVPFSGQSLRAMLNQLGVSVDGPLADYDQGSTAVAKLDVKNVAAVLVTAELPPFAKSGQKIDVNVSAIGKASSLRGGNLIMTRLRGANGSIYAVAQGSLTIAAVEASAAGSSVSTGPTTSGRIPGGAMVEKTVETAFEKSESVVLNILSHDFTTANAVMNGINEKFGAGTATAIDGMSNGYRVIIPKEAVGDRAKGPHDANLFDMGAKMADVIPTAEVLEYLDGLPASRGSRAGAPLLTGYFTEPAA